MKNMQNQNKIYEQITKEVLNQLNTFFRDTKRISAGSDLKLDFSKRYNGSLMIGVL